VCAGPPADGWAEVRVPGAFRIRAPAGTVYTPAPGPDSVAGAMTGPRFELHVDFGLYSDPLTGQRYENAESRTLSIDGRTAILTTGQVRGGPQGKPHFIGLHVPDVAPSGIGSLKLTFTGWLSAHDDYVLVESMLQTIEFEP